MALTGDGLGRPFTSIDLSDSHGHTTSTGKQMRVDTQSPITSVRWQNLRGGTWTFGYAKPVAGASGAVVGRTVIKNGTMTFKAQPAGGGAEVDVQCSKEFYILPFNLLGMDQVKEANCKVDWDPVTETGHLVKRA